jgi:C-terminal processing protease CtpA/Prc
MLSQTEKGIIIEEVIHSSPAAQVGLMPLDIIVKVNGTGIQDQNVQEVVQLIR